MEISVFYNKQGYKIHLKKYLHIVQTPGLLQNVPMVS